MCLTTLWGKSKIKSHIHQLTFSQQSVELALVSKACFSDFINDKNHKPNKGVGLHRKLQSILPFVILLTIYKSSVRPYFNYADVIYDQPSNALLSKRIERVQYNEAIGVSRGSPIEKVAKKYDWSIIFKEDR